MSDKNLKRVAAGKKSRRKGSSNELALAKLFKQWWGHGEWARTPLSGGWATKEAREGFRTCGDVITTAEDFPFCLEAKKQEGWTVDNLLHNDKPVLLEWWQQVVDETPEGMIPLLLASRNFVPQLAIFNPSWLEVYGTRHNWGQVWNGELPCRPWEHFDHLVLRVAVTAPIGENLVLMSLDNFFKMDPYHFGRTRDAEREQPAQPAEAGGQAKGS